jgi:hypothetical protein
LKRREPFQTRPASPSYQSQIRTLPEKENYRLGSLVTLSAKVLSKIPATQIQQNIKKITIKWDLPLGCKDDSTCINQQMTHYINRTEG